MDSLSRKKTLSRRIFGEILILLNFFSLTAAMTWPWVTRLRDAVSDQGDPYMIAWTLWWDYHQTFTDPLNLFHANVFYPYKYTLAFSEHEYGIAVLFFPLFALGLRALTVQSIATFCGFAFSGYGAFRLGRTLTRSNPAAWIAGIIFAFVPYRFHVLSHLHYLFAGWIPLLLEALVLFARERTWRRASWLGVAFTMNALTCATYFILTLVPLALSAAFLILHYRIERDRAFWLRGATALGVASLVLLPFMLPYYLVMKLYGFVRSVDDVAVNSPTPMHWLVAEDRNRLWRGLGRGIADSGKHKLFPGLLPLLLALPAFLWPTNEPQATVRSPIDSRKRLLNAFDAAALAAIVVALLAAGYQGSTAKLFGVEIFQVVTTARALFVLLVVVVVRMCFAYPKALRWTREQNLIDSLRTAKRGDTFALAIIWIVCGFLGSLGMNFFLNRVLYDFVPLFRAIRIPTHWAMITYVGLAVLAGLGAQRLVERLQTWRPNMRPLVVNAIFVVIAVALLFELRAAPLRFVRGEVYPDEITLRLKQTPMRGGLVELPHDLGLALPHRYMLRAADHEKPLVNATSSFISPLTWEIQVTTETSPIPLKFLDLLESIPASYLVIHNSDIAPERRADYDSFLARAVESGRLRFIRSFGDRDDLYAVVKTEPQAETEAPMPSAVKARDWEELIKEDPVNLLGQYRSWSQAVYRFNVASYGQMPRYSQFLSDMQAVSRGIGTNAPGAPEEQAKLNDRMSQFAESWVKSAKFQTLYKDMGDEAYVDALTRNAGITIEAAEREALIDKLKRGAMTRGEVILNIVNSKVFAEKENTRSLVLLHYFGYFHRNPDDPPDNNLNGFNFWVKEVEKSGETSRLARGFMASGEYEHRGGK